MKPYGNVSKVINYYIEYNKQTSLFSDEEMESLKSVINEIETGTIQTPSNSLWAQSFLEELWNPVSISEEPNNNDSSNIKYDNNIQVDICDDDLGVLGYFDKCDADIDSHLSYNKSFQISPREPSWYIGMTAGFIKAISNIDRKLQGRILDAIADIAKAPLTLIGDTVKPLTGELKGMWRYRIGDYRIVYQPDETSKHILLLTFAPRGGVYD
jgi:mRNA-degrading endonuclease RelE of RelBE toxin-antitoxin system